MAAAQSTAKGIVKNEAAKSWIVAFPAHHDAPMMGHGPVWRPTEPLFQAMKDENPKLVTVSREYREPTCFNTEYNLLRKK